MIMLQTWDTAPSRILPGRDDPAREEPDMSQGTLIYPSGMIIEGLVRYKYTSPHRGSQEIETRRFRFFTPLSTRWRAQHRLMDVLDKLYGQALGPDWTAAFDCALPIEAPEELSGCTEQFLPVMEELAPDDGAPETSDDDAGHVLKKRVLNAA
jgi:hypothetical protein